MAQVRVTDRNGQVHSVDAGDGQPLMEALRDANLGVAGTCGGACACGTCHVYVDPGWMSQLPGRGDDEQLMLEAIGELVEVRTNSRLSCQITVRPELEGLTVAIGPVA